MRMASEERAPLLAPRRPRLAGGSWRAARRLWGASRPNRAHAATRTARWRPGWHRSRQALPLTAAASAPARPLPRAWLQQDERGPGPPQRGRGRHPVQHHHAPQQDQGQAQRRAAAGGTGEDAPAALLQIAAGTVVGAPAVRQQANRLHRLRLNHVSVLWQCQEQGGVSSWRGIWAVWQS